MENRLEEIKVSGRVISGMMVHHEQLGLGKVLEAEEDRLTVAFLFFWPAVTLRPDAVKVFVPSEEFKLVLNKVVKGELL
jgi:hypothetical protein